MPPAEVDDKVLLDIDVVSNAKSQNLKLDAFTILCKIALWIICKICLIDMKVKDSLVRMRLVITSSLVV